MKLRIRVRREGPGFDERIQSLKLININIKTSLINLGNATKSHMGLVIKQNKRREGGNSVLEKSIKIYTEPLGKHRFDVGIGLVSEMDRLAPYWAVINWGGYSGGTKKSMATGRGIPGYFGDHQPPLAMKHGGTERWHYAKGFFLMKPHQPISPMNYIEKTSAWIRTILASKRLKGGKIKLLHA